MNDELAWVLQAQQGNDEAFTKLVEEHQTNVYNLCYRMLGEPEAAEDAAQETFLRAWRNSHVLDRSPASLRAWLYTVARNIVIDEWRTHRSERELSVEQVPEGNGVSDRTDDLLLSWIVADAVMKLSPEHRAVLLECYYRGASVAEAARRLDIPTGTVKSRSHYALRALALALEEMGVSP